MAPGEARARGGATRNNDDVCARCHARTPGDPCRVCGHGSAAKIAAALKAAWPGREKECARLLSILERRLDGRDFLCGQGRGEYSLADVSSAGQSGELAIGDVCVGVRGATYSGSGSAGRSTSPFAASGSASSATTTDGTVCAGSADASEHYNFFRDKLAETMSEDKISATLEPALSASSWSSSSSDRSRRP